MSGPAKGEDNSPGIGWLEWSGTGGCENPRRVASAGLHSGAASGGARRRLTETLRRRWIWRAIAGPAKRVRGDPEKSGSRSSPQNPRGAKPKEGAGDRRLKTPFGRKALSGGMAPEIEACQAGLTLRRQRNCQANGRWVRLGRKVLESSRKGKPSKGESQERRRCETEPARDSRE
jgi:hypothetical protein